VSARRMTPIYLELSTNPIITNNTILECWDSIRVIDSPNGLITGNYIDGPGMGIFINDCGNHTITNNTALSSNRGVELWGNSDGNYIAYNNFSYNLYGIWIDSNCDDNEIINNTLSDGYMGIYVESSSRINIIGNEIINNSDTGIYFYASDSVISENIISYNKEYGLFTVRASNLNITKNEFINDGIYLGGSELDHFTSHEIPDDNTVNGKPLYYYKNTSSLNFDGISIGQLILANCSDVNVNNLNINQTDVGIEMAYVSNANITGCNVSSNDLFGFYIYSSINVNISDNVILSNKEVGIYLSTSQYNTISENNVSFNNLGGGWGGIFVASSPDNIIVKNQCISNDLFGIRLSSSPNSYILENEVKGSSTGITIWNSDNCELSNNNVSDNQYGIRCSDSWDVLIMRNNITENYWGMYIDYSPNINITENTVSFQTIYGIYLYGTEQAEMTLNVFINDGLFLRGWDVLAYNTHDISVNNMVNGKPMYYYKNATNIDIEGIPVGQLIIANCTDFDVSNVEIDYTDVGIQIAYSSNINVTASTISNNYHGIYSLYTSNNKIIGSNITANSLDGIHLYYSNDDFISANYIFSNSRFGIYILDSSFTNLTNNIFVKDGIFIRGDLSSSTSHNIPVNNMVNGKPLYYYKNVNGFDINGISVGQLLLANCTGINIMNLQINDTDVGIEFLYTNYLNISGCSIYDNYYGLYALDSWYNNIRLNSVYLNDANGIHLSYSRYNIIEYNSFSQNNGYGMYLDDAGYNQIFNNSIVSNGVTGIFLYDWASNNEIIGNNISDNAVGIDLDSDSGGNHIYHNNFIDNTIQAREDSGNNWNDDYPSGGNYWSDFSPTCPDLYNGSVTPQTTGSSDGICDSKYDGNYFYDYYPLKYPWGVISPDITPPAKIIDLSVFDPTIDSLNLTWTAPGDDDDSGSASGYVVKYSTTGPITEFNWNSASTYIQSWTPLPVNSTETYMISGLDMYTTYWFAIRAFDEMGNYGLISNIASGTTLHTDMIPPAAITDLNASIPTNSSITLTWTASADNSSDPASGNASYYDIRYLMGTEITTINWDSATQVGGEPSPEAYGTLETLVVDNLLPGTTYYFAIKVGDEVTFWSPLSNSPNATTLGNDTTSPVISELAITPEIQEIGGTVSISAKVMDNVAVSTVSIEIKYPSSTVIGNFTMTKNGDIYNYEFIASAPLGPFSFTIWTADINDNYASQMGSFEIVDTTLPIISDLMANPSPQELHEDVNIAVTVVDNVDVEEVWLQILNPQGVELENITMNRLDLTDSYWYVLAYSMIGDFECYIWAKDESNNWAVTGDSFTIQDTILPIADAGSPQNIQQGTEIVFDGSSSSDNDVIENYTWTFNYDGETVSLYGINPSFKFEVIGNYTITLTVDDPSGNSASTSIWINVFGVDKDGDGLTDHDEENIYETNPNVPDTDGDGVNDGDEIDRGTDPLVPDKIKGPGKSFLEESWWIFVVLAIIIMILIIFLLARRKPEEAIKGEVDLEEDPGGKLQDEPDKIEEP
jgi:parallel beta-helix repeat protein